MYQSTLFTSSDEKPAKVEMDIEIYRYMDIETGCMCSQRHKQTLERVLQNLKKCSELNFSIF